MADLVHKMRAESNQKLNEADRMAREANDLVFEIRATEAQLKIMRARVDDLNYQSNKLRVEGDRLKNQAFVMSLGAPKNENI